MKVLSEQRSTPELDESDLMCKSVANLTQSAVSSTPPDSTNPNTFDCHTFPFGCCHLWTPILFQTLYIMPSIVHTL